MQITDKKQISKKFSDVLGGEVFRYDGNFYLKLDAFYEDYNCVNLTTGELDFISIYEEVSPRKAELVLS